MTISEVNCNISSSTLKLRIVSYFWGDFYGILHNFPKQNGILLRKRLKMNDYNDELSQVLRSFWSLGRGSGPSKSQGNALSPFDLQIP